MLAVTHTSSNDWLATLLGALGALVPGIAAFGAWLESRPQEQPRDRLAYQFVLIAFGAACLGSEVHSMFACYDDAAPRFRSLDTTVCRRNARHNHHRRRRKAMRSRRPGLKKSGTERPSLTLFDGFATG